MLHFASPGNVAFSIFGFDVYYYGITMAAAIAVMLFLAAHISKQCKLNDIILEVAPAILLSGFVGARLYYCILDWQYYFRHPFEILAVRNGGLSVHGAIFAGLLSIFVICKKRGVSIASVYDIFAFSAPLAQAIGRWGNFFNAEAFGTPTELPWKMYVAIQNRPMEYINNEYFHPAFLYESLCDMLIFGVMLLLWKKGVFQKTGVPSCVYLILYSTVRIFIECIRTDSTVKLAGIAFPVYASAVILIIVSLILFKRLK